MKKQNFKSSRKFILLLFIAIICLFYCKKKLKKNEDRTKNEHSSVELSELALTDSIPISVFVKDENKLALNLRDQFFNHYNLFFINKGKDSLLITKKIPRLSNIQMLGYSVAIRLKDKKLKVISYKYLIKKEASEILFGYTPPNLNLIKGKGIIDVSDLSENYMSLRLENKKRKKNKKIKLERQLDSMFKYYQEKSAVNKSNSINKYNKLLYIYSLQEISPFDIRIEKYLNDCKKPIICHELTKLLSTYVKNRSDSLDFKILNTSNHALEYIDLLALGVYEYLKLDKNMDLNKKMFQWLMTTNFYKNNKAKIDKDLKPIKKEELTDKLKALTLLDLRFNKTLFAEVIKQNPSEYYLIDFWATWCAPCINGIKTMKELTLPSNIMVINLSVDKIKVKDKWQTKSKELGLEFSYLVDNQKENKEFIKMIGLNRIPRYIIIDKDFNLIDANFLHPAEPDFLKELKRL